MYAARHSNVAARHWFQILPEIRFEVRKYSDFMLSTLLIHNVSLRWKEEILAIVMNMGTFLSCSERRSTNKAGFRNETKKLWQTLFPSTATLLLCVTAVLHIHFLSLHKEL
jgi:hypothetical protein